jgi:hypothetical protein
MNDRARLAQENQDEYREGPSSPGPAGSEMGLGTPSCTGQASCLAPGSDPPSDSDVSV